MTTIHFTQPNTRFRGSYTVPVHMAEEARTFLGSRGYVVYREIVR